MSDQPTHGAPRDVPPASPVTPDVGVPATAAPQYSTASAPAPTPAPARAGRWLWPVFAFSVLIGITACGWLVWAAGTADMGSVGLGDAIAVIPIDGVIAGTGGTGVITPEGFREQLNLALDDDMVKAIVLRVDSPGGTVAASEEISMYVKASDKPVVVSVGDVDASGAYMVSSQADEIIALPGSAVGSIGVIMEIPNVAGLLDKLGVEFTVITAGKYKDAGSPYRPLTATETALIQGSVDEVYLQFIDIVAEGRGMERSEVESLATGWAWNGTEAKRLGLVDEIGTFDDALEAAADLGKIEGEYETIYYDEPQFEDLLGSVIGLTRQLSDNMALSPPGVLNSAPAVAK